MVIEIFALQALKGLPKIHSSLRDDQIFPFAVQALRDLPKFNLSLT
jgi:hypothetical protein